VGDGLAKLEAPLFDGHARALFYGNHNEIGTAAVTEATPSSPRNQFDWDGRSFGLEWRRSPLRMLVWSATGDATADWSMPVGRIAMNGERDDAGLRFAVSSEGVLATSALELDARVSRTKYSTVPDSAGAIFALDSRMPMVTLALRQTLNVGEGIELDSYVPVTLADQVTRAAPALRIQWIQSPLLTFSGAYLRTHQ
jgi:hypothetical protein